MRERLVLMPDEMLHRSRFAMPVTPYRRGFEDAAYEGVYCNPHPAGSDAFWEYDRGFQAAMGQGRDSCM